MKVLKLAHAHFNPMFCLYTPWKRQKSGIEMEHWAIKWVNKKDTRTIAVSFL